MWLDLFKLGLFIITLTLAGWVLVFLSSRKIKKEFTIELFTATFLGLGVVTWWMMILNYFTRFTQINIFLPWLALGGVAAILKYRSVPVVKFADLKTVAASILLLLLLIIFSYQALSRDSLAFDAVNNWVFKGKVFFIEKNLPPFFFNNDIFLNANVYNNYNRNQLHYLPDYPNLVPLSFTALFFFLGDVNIKMAKMLWVVLFFLYLVIFFHFIKEKTPKFSYYFLFFTASLPIFYEETVGNLGPYADIILSYYLFLGGVNLYRKKFLLAILLFCFGAWTKNEGLIPLVIVSSYYFWKRLYKFLAIPILVLSPWWFFYKINGIVSSALYFGNFISMNSFISKTIQVSGDLLVQLADLKLFNISWFFLVFLLWQRKKISIVGKFVLISLSSILIFHFLTVNDPYNMGRLYFAYLPLLFYEMALMAESHEKSIV